MSDKRTDQLPAAGPLTGAEPIHVVQDGQSRQSTTGDIAGIQHDHTIDDVAGLAAALAKLSTYIFGFSFEDPPTDGEVLARHVAGVPFTLPADFAGGIRIVGGVNPDAVFVLTVAKNGTTIGTITIDTAGAVTLATTDNVAQAVAAGELLTVKGPDTADAAIAGWSFTFIGAS